MANKPTSGNGQTSTEQVNNTNLLASLKFKRTIKTQSTSGTTSLEGKIKKEINTLIHDFLLKEYPHLYKELDNTQVVKVKSKTDKVENIIDVSGYRLLIPTNRDVNVEHEGNKLVFKNALMVSSPQIYLQGIKNHRCEYVKIGGQTCNFDETANDFTTTA